MRRLGSAAAVLALVLVLAGCAAERDHRAGLDLLAAGQSEAGLAKLRAASNAEPTNSEYRIDLLKHQAYVIRGLLAEAADARRDGHADRARAIYLQAMRVEPNNDRALKGIEQLDDDARQAALIAQAEQIAAKDPEAAYQKLHEVLDNSPSNVAAQKAIRKVQDQLDKLEEQRKAKAAAASILKRPVTLQFREANLRMVFEALSRTTGLNVIFDRDIRPDLKATIFVKDATVEDTVDLILLQSQLEKKVLNANTLFIYPNTVAKQKEYQDLQVRTFQISNGDAKYLESVLKSVLKIKDVALDERSNTLVVRDSADAVGVAEKVIAAHDLPDPEVMLEVEVLEVTRSRLADLGIQWPNQLTVTTPTPASGTVTIGDLAQTTLKGLTTSTLSATANFKLQESDANILASPRIRTRNREKAKIMIGDRVPTIVKTVTPTTTGAAVVTGSATYQDVGIKLEVEPTVYLEGDVGIKLNLEVSSITNTITGSDGSVYYQIGTRNAQTSLRLRDGETQIMGGLISDSDQRSANKVPGLGQLPIAGRLFADHSDNDQKSEVILSITPHVLRGQAVADERLRDVYSGTDSTIRLTPLRLEPTGNAASASTEPVVPGVVGGGGAPGGTPGGAPVMPVPTPRPGNSPAPEATPNAAPNDAGTDAVTPNPPGPVRRGPGTDTSANPRAPSEAAAQTLQLLQQRQQGLLQQPAQAQ